MIIPRHPGGGNTFVQNTLGFRPTRWLYCKGYPKVQKHSGLTNGDVIPALFAFGLLTSKLISIPLGMINV
jgi:hypothetical protein